MFVKIKKYYNELYETMTIPYGINKNFDKECDNSLINFIDNIYNFLLFLYFFACAGSIYFFTKHEILNVY